LAAAARVVGESAVRAGFCAQRHPVKRCDRRAHRHADDLGAAQPRIGYRGQHPTSRSGADPVGPARAGIGFMDHHGHPATAQRAAPRRQVGGHCDVTAEADHDVGIDVFEHGSGLLHRPAHPHRQAKQVAGELAGQRHRRDELQVVTPLRDQPGFQSAVGAERGDPHLGVERAQRIGDSHGGFDVACRPAAGENYGNRPIHP
jgi:hypothetical protein